MEGLTILGNLFIRLPVLGAYAVGVLLSAVLVSRRRDGASWLALVGFGLLLAVNLASWFLAFLPIWLASTRNMTTIAQTIGCLHTILNLISAAGVLCLAFALWTGLQPPTRR